MPSLSKRSKMGSVITQVVRTEAYDVENEQHGMIFPANGEEDIAAKLTQISHEKRARPKPSVGVLWIGLRRPRFKNCGSGSLGT